MGRSFSSKLGILLWIVCIAEAFLEMVFGLYCDDGFQLAKEPDFIPSRCLIDTLRLPSLRLNF